MKLIIGGAASGKLNYVRSLGYTEDQLANAVLDNRPVIYNLQALVASLFTPDDNDNPQPSPADNLPEPLGDPHDKSQPPVAENVSQQMEDSRERALAFIEPLLAKEVVVCDEVGAGVIPGNRPEREAREATGRLCNRLAQQAQTVIRLVAGIPVVIKG